MTNKYSALSERFLNYVRVDTRSDEDATKRPSSDKEVAFLRKLAQELATIGLSDIQTMSDGYVFAKLPASPGLENVPNIGFIAHVDTADFNSENIQPQIVENYDGKSIIPLGTTAYQLDPAVFPSLNKYQGHTLITTDGTTLLGADDKAGVAEIITAIEYLINHPDIQHGPVSLAFGPDEEIGTGADHFDTKAFGADFAYTVDGGPLGELEWETFNAASAKLHIQGQNVHPGTAKGAMINANQVAMDFHAQLPVHDRPEETSGREGFWHLIEMSGTPDEANLTYIIRDHDRQKFESRKDQLIAIADQFNAKFGQDRLTLTIQDQYYNMGDILKENMAPVELAEQAMQALSIKPIIEPIRGGTDGSKISFLGLPTPNLFAGGENMHGRFEYVSLEVMEAATDVILKIIELAR
ncbi:peptidase T [Convivina intestini]|uniref:Peptidase T n=1 Tax=Convivina intestini TaxID=1505726 RepID=A0A2U1DEU5_9LACO|nr:peptidase T [Convivina intestini]PVY86203.1 tripeptide aminopeptidase [Convivina intestini]CAH1851368.1 Peptidase T [Convivina intestini]SDB81466.1 tripeptide aminopeptidase [Leuconostocaceae bacterium R-53105]